jgi:transcriptional regulator with XRE-family HTH domain
LELKYGAGMTETLTNIQMVRPRETRQALGLWVRLARQRLNWTQPMLAAKSGVPVATLSRLEREGQGGLESFLRVLQALGGLDSFHAQCQEQIRKASLPSDISRLNEPLSPIRKRVRIRAQPKGRIGA